MKILFINSEYPPIGAGAGNASANLARNLVRMGSEVTLVSSGFRGLENDETLEGVRILRGPSIRKRVDRSTAFEQVVFIAAATYRCLHLMREFKPDVVLAFFGLPSGAVAWMLKIYFGIPYVVSLRGGDVPGFRPYDFWLYHRIAVPLLHVIWHGASAVVANSTGLRDLARVFDSSIEIRVVPNGVDLQWFTVANRSWVLPRILSVGRVVHQKGFDLAVRALEGLKDLEWEWHIAGDGPQLAALKEMVKERGLQNRVRFLGWQSASQLRGEYTRANLFLFPSRHEGMPNAILEAMACGLPVIATRIAGNEELVLEETGILVPTENVEALKGALRRLLTASDTCTRMGFAARTRVERSFGWHAAATQYRGILERAVK